MEESRTIRIMTSVQRSTLRLDLKDLAPRTTTPHIGRLGLVAISVVAVVSAVVSINSPSASVANVENLDGIDITLAEARAEIPPLHFADERAEAVPEQSGTPESGIAADAADLSNADNSKSSPGVSDEPPTVATLEPAAGINIPGILRATPEGGTEAIRQSDNRIRLASLAPVIQREATVPLVNLIEAEPQAETAAPREDATDIVLPEPTPDFESDIGLAAINPVPFDHHADNPAAAASTIEAIETVVTIELPPFAAAPP